VGAPKENQFWKLRSTHGREKLFATPDLMWDAACEYFEWCEENPLIEIDFRGKDSDEVRIPKMRPYTLQGLCRYLDCNTVYFNQFEKALREKDDEMSKGFSQIVTRIREAVYEQKFSGAAAGFLNPNIIARDLGLKEHTEATGKDGTALFPSVAVSMPAGTDINLPSNVDGE
jgi:hypothetical protein